MFSKTVNSAKALQCRAVVSKGPFIATQLNSTRHRVELSCVGEVSIVDADATQLNSTRQREQLSPISSERRDPVRVSIATQLNSTQLDVELSGVASAKCL